jgi:hypothetical protein
MFTQWIKDRRNWYVDRETGHMYVFTFNPDMVTVKKDGKTYIVQQMACYNVALFQQNDEIQKAYNAFLSDRNEAREAWEAVEMRHVFPQKLIRDMKEDEQNEDYLTKGYSLEKCNGVNAYYDNLVKLASDMRSRTYRDYYKKVWEYASEIDPNCGKLQLLFSDFLMAYYSKTDQFNLLKLYNDTYAGRDQDECIEDFKAIRYEENWQQKYHDRLVERVEWMQKKIEITQPRPCWDTPSLLARVGQKELQTRRLFWRLFNDKFNVTYEKFLTDRTTAESILNSVPNLFGPSGCDLDTCFEDHLSRKAGQSEEDFYLDCAGVFYGTNDVNTNEEEESEEESEPEYDLPSDNDDD